MNHTKLALMISIVAFFVGMNVVYFYGLLTGLDWISDSAFWFAAILWFIISVAKLIKLRQDIKRTKNAP